MAVRNVFDRMRPSTLVAIICDLDDTNPEDYTVDDIDVLYASVLQLIALVGVSDAIEMLADADVCADNPVIDNAFEEVQS